MNVFTPEQIQELLDAAKPSVIETIKNDLIRSVTYDVQDTAARLIKAHIETWIKENILPEISKQLVESKESLISVGVAAAPQLVQQLATAMTEALAENLKSQWERKKIFEALLG
jgi:hypothetical protein